MKFESCLHSDAYIFSSSNGGVEVVCSAERSLQGLHDGVLRFDVESSIEILSMLKVPCPPGHSLAPSLRAEPPPFHVF